MHNVLKKAVSVTMAVTLILGGIVVKNRQEKVVQAADNYKLVWNDEFDGDELNRDYWNVEVNGYGGWNNELQYYCDSPENIEVSDGTLKLKALKKQYQGKEYTSARLNTQNKVTVNCGKVEARIKLPKFMGSFPAFWMMGASGENWPYCGEIDIMEAINDESVIYGTAHWACDYATNDQGYDSSGSNTDAAGIDLEITEWHTYGIEWSEDRITWYVDNKNYHTVKINSEKQMEELADPAYLLLNLAVGGDWPGFEVDESALPVTMEVDYVRAYERTSHEMGSSDSVSEHKGTWEAEIGSWAKAEGSMSAGDNPSDGFELNLSAVGNHEWGIQVKLNDLDYIAGHNYTLKCVLLSDIDKNAFIKIEGEGTSELAGEYISLKANTPYAYEKELFIPWGYTGPVKLLIAPGGSMNGESVTETTAMNLKVTDVSFVTPIEIEQSTTEKETESDTTVKETEFDTTAKETKSETTVEVTTSADDVTTEETTMSVKETVSANESSRSLYKPLGKVEKGKVKKATKKNNAVKVKLTLKKLKNATKYQVKISSTKRFKKNKAITRLVKKEKVQIRIRKFAKAKKLYVKVRGVNVQGKKIRYGQWSKTKRIKIIKKSKQDI